MVRRSTYMQEYHELTRTQGVPFVTERGMEGHFSFRVSFWLRLLFVQFIFGPFGPGGQPDSDDHSDRTTSRLLLFCGLYALLFRSCRLLPRRRFS